MKVFSVLAFSSCVKLLSVDDNKEFCKSFFCFLSVLRLKALISDCMLPLHELPNQICTSPLPLVLRQSVHRNPCQLPVETLGTAAGLY